MLSQDLIRIIDSIQDLPTLPIVYEKLQVLLTDPKVTAGDVAKVIEEDQALTAKILKLVNSAYYGFPQKVSTITQAVVVLGFNEIRNVALSVSVIQMFNDDVEEGFDHLEFWKHSLAVAICSGLIAKQLGTNKVHQPDVAFTAGILHDIGKVICQQFFHTKYQLVLEYAKENNAMLIEAEREILRFTHEQVGQILIEKWKLPSELVSVVGYANSPYVKERSHLEYPLVAVVHVADAIVRAAGIGFGGDPFVPPINDKCVQFIDLSQETLEQIIRDTIELFEGLASLLLSKDDEETVKEA